MRLKVQNVTKNLHLLQKVPKTNAYSWATGWRAGALVR
jgi:hypothetical protein